MIPTEQNKAHEVQQKIESFRSTGTLYRHPFPEFYYTEGVKFAVRELFNMDKLLFAMVREISGLSDNRFVLIRVYRNGHSTSRIEYRDRNGQMLGKTDMDTSVPLSCGVSLCVYWIGRTLLLPTEY